MKELVCNYAIARFRPYRETGEFANLVRLFAEPHAPAHGDGAHADASHGDHGQGAPLGPVDWPAWGAGLLGIAAGLVVAACLYLSTTL